MIYAFDLEIYKNFFSAIFVNIENEFDIKEYVVYQDRNDIEELKSFLQQSPVLVGFNNINFDNIFLNAILLNRFNFDLFYEIAQKIVSEEKETDEIKNLRNIPVPYDSIDVMRVMAFDTLGFNLKQVGINLKWHRIQDLPLQFDTEIQPENINIILDYNLNDVLITRELYLRIYSDIQMREEFGKQFNVDLRSSSNSHMANSILNKIYTQKTFVSYSQLKDLRTYRKQVKVSECISHVIQFESLVFQKLKNELSKIVLYQDNNFSFKKQVSYKGITFDVGVGGLHSRDEAAIFNSTDNEIIIDADVSSFYPNIVLNNELCPKHLDKESFTRIYRELIEERLAAKKAGDYVKSYGLKIAINSCFGKFGSEYFWLYDPKVFYSVTINGQLYLLMLVERLFRDGIKVISANTDGVVCQIPNDKLELYYQICDKWQQDTNFELEFSVYKRYIRRDVNNYITFRDDGKLKAKGIFESELSRKSTDFTYLAKGYKSPIISIALHKYFIENAEVRESLESHTDIYDFLISQKTAKKFTSVYKNNGTETELQKNNRFYVANNGGEFVKRDGKKEIAIAADQKVKILNNVPLTYDIKEFDINYDWYEQEIMKIVNKIEPSSFSLSLF